jgi:hypothetical protein
MEMKLFLKHPEVFQQNLFISAILSRQVFCRFHVIDFLAFQIKTWMQQYSATVCVLKSNL